jgi:hypothetical protein
MTSEQQDASGQSRASLTSLWVSGGIEWDVTDACPPSSLSHSKGEPSISSSFFTAPVAKSNRSLSHKRLECLGVLHLKTNKCCPQNQHCLTIRTTHTLIFAESNQIRKIHFLFFTCQITNQPGLSFQSQNLMKLHLPWSSVVASS